MQGCSPLDEVPQKDFPAEPADPYPPEGTVVTAACHESAMRLMRLREALATRGGREDADYITAAPYLVNWQDGAGDWHSLIVPAGMLTDLTSVPVGLRWIVGRVGPWLEAAIVHDYLYIAWQRPGGATPRRADQAFADDLMLALMQAAGVRWRGRLIHLALRWFGWSAFRRVERNRWIRLSDSEVRRQMLVEGSPTKSTRPSA